MLNSNPETVSTDYDTSDRLYLEPVTLERVLDVVRFEQPLGVVVSLGGQTPLRLARALQDAGVPLLGDPLPAIEAAEDRGAFAHAPRGDRPARAALGHRRDDRGGARARPGDRRARPRAPALRARRPRDAHRPRPGRRSRRPSPSSSTSTSPARSSSTSTSSATASDAWVAGILEHVEPAGVHSGDSACVFPGPSVTRGARGGDPRARAAARRPARRARPAQPPARACAARDLYVIEANPRASRTIPSSRRRPGSRSSTTPAGCCSAPRSTSSTCPSAPSRPASGRRRRSSRRTASRTPPTAARR